MSYHNVTMVLVSDDSNPERLFWDIATQYSEHSTPHSGEAYTDKADGYKIIRWVSNDRVIPKDIMDKLVWPHKALMNEARDEQTRATLEAYITSQAERTPDQTAEEEYEMRAAFGAGAKVVNVITGKRTQL